MKRPLVVLAIVFSLGICVASKTRAAFWLVYFLGIIFLLLSSFSFKKRAQFDVFLCGLVFFLAASLWGNSRILPRHHISKYISYQNNYPYIVKGAISSQPFFKDKRTTFIFSAGTIQLNNAAYNTCGHILVHLKGRYNLDYAQELILKGNLYRPFRFGRDRGQSYRDYLYSQGIFALMNVKSASHIIKLNKKKRWFFRGMTLWLKKKIEDIIFNRVSPTTAAILAAMLLGEKKYIPPLINNFMIKSGTVHILVVSGFNVGLVGFVIILALKLIRLPRRMRFYLATPLLISYCFITGASTPVIRATVMAIVFIFAYLVKRESDVYNSCALAGIFILGANPRQLFDVGFQLSFASVISIVYLYPRMKSLLIRSNNPRAKYLRFLIDGCLVSLAAWLGTAGLIAYYFKIVSPVTVLANIFIVPLASLITLCGFSLIIMEQLLPFLAPCLASSCELLTILLLKISALLVNIPGAYFYLSG